MSAEESRTVTLMERLKESTRLMHENAESSRFQAELTNADLSRDLYLAYLKQLYLIHSALEKALKRHESFAPVVSNSQYQEPFLRKDLAYFGADAKSIEACAAADSFIKEIEAMEVSCPAALLAVHYVLLGSKHGGKFIAKNCRERYALPPDSGALYFDPYGNNFMSVWKEFKEKMNELDLSRQQEDELCRAAGKTFQAIYDIGAELKA